MSSIGHVKRPLQWTRRKPFAAISDKNRAIVIDYFIELGITLNLFDETVTYGITIFDRYCETLSVRIPRDEIQFISKYTLDNWNSIPQNSGIFE